MRRILQHLPLLALILAARGATQPPAELRLVLNIPAQQLAVYAGAERIRVYGVAVGLLENRTPVGNYRITRAEWNPWWHPPTGSAWARGQKVTPPGPGNPMGRVKLHFAPLLFIHGTPHRESLGAPASRGCVRMLNEDAVELARLLHRHARPSLPASEIPALLDGPRLTRISEFARPVPLEVRYDLVSLEGRDLLIHDDVYGRGGLTPEAVLRAVRAAGHGGLAVSTARVQELLRRAGSRAGTFRIPLAELGAGPVGGERAGAAPAGADGDGGP